MEFEYEAEEQVFEAMAYSIIDKSFEVDDDALTNALHTLGRSMLEDARDGESNTVRKTLIDV